MSASRSIPFEVFPSFEIDSITVSTAFRGATPASVQDGLTTRIEEAIYDIEGVKEISSRSAEGVSTVIAELESGVDKRKLLNDIKLRVDSLNSLPQAAERPVVSLSSFNPDVIQVAVTGEVDIKTLRVAADQIREDLLRESGITLVELLGVSNYEVSVEITPSVLDSYKLSLIDVAHAIQRGSVDVSAGNIKNPRW